MVKSLNRFLNIFQLPMSEASSLIDYFPKNTIVFIDEISRVHEMNDSLEKEEAEWYTSLISEGNIIHDLKMSHNLTELLTNVRIASCLFILVFTTCTKYKSAKYY